jgi:hypothetical protein
VQTGGSVAIELDHFSIFPNTAIFSGFIQDRVIGSLFYVGKY